MNSTPKNINWKDSPIPNPELCHPDTRIILYRNLNEKESIVILAPKTRYTSNVVYWVDDKDQIWMTKDFTDPRHISRWDWWKSFHETDQL